MTDTAITKAAADAARAAYVAALDAAYAARATADDARVAYVAAYDAAALADARAAK